MLESFGPVSVSDWILCLLQCVRLSRDLSTWNLFIFTSTSVGLFLFNDFFFSYSPSLPGAPYTAVRGIPLLISSTTPPYSQKRRRFGIFVSYMLHYCHLFHCHGLSCRLFDFRCAEKVYVRLGVTQPKQYYPHPPTSQPSMKELMEIRGQPLKKKQETRIWKLSYRLHWTKKKLS